MHEADRDLVVQSDDQSGRIEVRLRENELFEKGGRHRLHPASLRRLVAPDVGQARRIRISKRAERIHGGPQAGVVKREGAGGYPKRMLDGETRRMTGCRMRDAGDREYKKVSAQ